MNQTIRTYKDLCAEKDRLQQLLVIQKQQVIIDWQDVKHEFQPVSNVFGVVGKMAKGDKSNPLLYTGLGIVSDMLLKNFVLAKTGWVTRLAVPFIMKNYSSHILANKGAGLIGKLGSIFRRKP